MRRIQFNNIIKDLSHKMVLIAGPRQVGKTYIAKQIAKEFKSPVYLNYDSIVDRKIIIDQSWLTKTDLLIFDELHKMAEWKNYLKGIYDTKPDHMHILVTGSARLDIYNHIGDSLAGRYFLHRLLPLSPAELKQLNITYLLEDLITKSGFPEPFFASEKVEADRWRLQYVNSLLTTDVFDFDKVQNIKALRTIFDLLRTKVGSPVSYQSLAEDVAISPMTVKKYIQIMEALYIIFRITPFSNNIARSLLKEPKIYFFDTALVNGNEGVKWENLTALCLLKHTYGKIDYLAENYALHYLRTKEQEEVDFALVKDGKIEKIIEVKSTNSELSKALLSFSKKYDLNAIQTVKELRQERMVDGIPIVKLENFLTELYL